jgi:hypothetical protein
MTAAMMSRKGYTIKKIAEHLNRSYSAVEHRLARIDVWGSGNYIPESKRKERKEDIQRKVLVRRFIALLLIRRNGMDFSEYWQKDMCMNWHNIRGCLANEHDCDSCISFIRIRPQYCVRCGATIISRDKVKICQRCADQRKKQAQRKYAITHKPQRIEKYG